MVDFLKDYKDIFVWCLLGIVGTIFLYRVGIKKDWQEMRIKHGLVEEGVKNPPKIHHKCHFNKFSYLGTCLYLFLITILFSASIIFLYSIQNVTNKFDSVSNVGKAFFSLLFIYSLFIGIPTNKESIIDKDTSKFYYGFMTLFATIKAHCIEIAISTEKRVLRENIMKKIDTVCEKKDLGTSCFVLRIGSEFLNKKIPSHIEQSYIEQMQDLSIEIVNGYVNKHPILIDHIKDFFKYAIKYDVKIYDIVEFVINYDKAMKTAEKDDIDNQLSEILAKRESKVPKATTNDLEKLLYEAETTSSSFNIVFGNSEDPEILISK